MKNIIVISHNENLINSIEKSSRDFKVLHRKILREAVEEALGIKTGSIAVELVVIDASMFDSFNPEELVNRLLGAGIPLFVYASDHDRDWIWKMSALGVLPLRLESMNEDFHHALRHRKYDYTALEVENDFAKIYDEKELSSPATISAILWENEYVLKQIRTLVKQTNRPLKILDLGCGTGRMEEILLTDKELEEKIENIYAVDFAPMYLKKARERLAFFLPQKSLDRIIFSRHIAEDTRLPSNHFDVVIASFGVICFSQFHFTIPEIFRMLKDSGHVILNGYNRNSVLNEFSDHAESKEGSSAFFANIDQTQNKIILGEQSMPCFTFNIEELQLFLGYIGLQPLKGTTEIFPPLKFSSERMVPNCCKKAPMLPASYQTKNLHPYQISPLLHKKLGFYFSLTACKQGKQP